MIITCYRVSSGFTNVEDKITLDRPGYNQIYEEINVILPDGYTYDTDVYGQNYVISPDGKTCELALNSLHGNIIIAWTARGGKALRRAPDGHVQVHLQKVRAERGLSQQQLADASGVNIRQIQKVEMGEIEPGNMTARNLLAIADTLCIEARDLL